MNKWFIFLDFSPKYAIIRLKGGVPVKKLLLAITLLTSTILLSSCKVHWLGNAIDVPWYLVAIPVVVLLVVLYIFMLSDTYICPECKTEIKPKWYHFSIALHVDDKRVIKCPHCGRKGFCEKKK